MSHPVVARRSPLHRHHGIWHTAGRVKPRPQDEAIRPRISGRDAQGEGILAKHGLRERTPREGQHYLPAIHQKVMRAFNCMRRASATVRILPKFALRTSAIGTPRLVWLKALNASARSCRLTFSANRKFFERETSTFHWPGERSEFLPTFPGRMVAPLAALIGT